MLSLDARQIPELDPIVPHRNRQSISFRVNADVRRRRDVAHDLLVEVIAIQMNAGVLPACYQKSAATHRLDTVESSFADCKSRSRRILRMQRINLTVPGVE